MYPRWKTKRIKTKSLPKCSFETNLYQSLSPKPKKALPPIHISASANLPSDRKCLSFREYVVKQYLDMLQPENNVFSSKDSSISPLVLERKLERLNPEAMKLLKSEFGANSIYQINESSQLESVIQDSSLTPEKIRPKHKRVISQGENSVYKNKEMAISVKTLYSLGKNPASTTNTLNTTGFSTSHGKLIVIDDLKEMQKTREILEKQVRETRNGLRRFMKKHTKLIGSFN